MQQRFSTRAAFALAVTLAFSVSQACYTFRPLPTSATPKLAERVRIVLTPEGTTELARYLGPNVVVAEGQLSTVRDDGTYVVAVDFVQQSNGIKQPWSGEGVVSIPAAYRTEVHERTFLRRQTIVASVVLGVSLITLAIVALKAAGALGGGDAGGTPPQP